MKEIKLRGDKGCGKSIKVSDEDFEYLNRFKWYPHSGKYTTYAYASYHKDRMMYHLIMHRVVMKVTDPKVQIDHIDGDGLNNQRSNLREATNSENNMNKRKGKRSHRSKYKGVSYSMFRSGTNTTNDKIRYWRASCKKGNISYHKLFKTEIEAALQYNKWAKELHGEFARLNDIPVCKLLLTEKS